MPAFNHEEYVDEAIRSVLAQTIDDFELIIIDDGSTDGTAARIRAHHDGRIRYSQQQNAGAPATINRGIALARGEFVGIINSDDVYYPTRLADLVQELDADAELDAVFTHLEFIDQNGEHVSWFCGPTELWKDRATADSFAGESNLALHLLAGNFVVTTSNIFCRRRVFERVTGFRNLRYLHDYDFLLRLCSAHKARVMEKPLVKYRLHLRNTIKEDESQTDYEAGLVLADFFMSRRLRDVLPPGDPHDLALKFLNSLNALNSEQMLLTLLLFVTGDVVPRQFVSSLMAESPSRFKDACVERIRAHIAAWQSSQEAWAKWQMTNERLIATDQRLQGVSDKLVETDARLNTAYAECKRHFDSGQEAWARVNDANERLVEADRKLAAAYAENERVFRSGQEASAKLNEANARLVGKEQELEAANLQIRNLWEETQQAWARWSETNERLIRLDQDLAASYSRIKELSDRHAATTRSVAWRLGRALTWPARTFLAVLSLLRLRARPQ